MQRNKKNINLRSIPQSSTLPVTFTSRNLSVLRDSKFWQSSYLPCMVRQGQSLQNVSRNCRYPGTRTFRLTHLTDDSPMTSVGALKYSVSKALRDIDSSSDNMEGLNKNFCRSLKMIAHKRQQLDGGI